MGETLGPNPYTRPAISRPYTGKERLMAVSPTAHTMRPGRARLYGLAERSVRVSRRPDSHWG